SLFLAGGRSVRHSRGLARRPGGRADRSAARGAEPCTLGERRAARTAGRLGKRPGDAEQGIERREMVVDLEQLVAALADGVLAEAVATEHLEEKASEIAQPHLAEPQQGPP